MTADHHSEYLTIAIGRLTPEGRARVDAILDELVAAAGNRPRLVRFASDRKVEVDLGRVVGAPEEADDPLTEGELDALVDGFLTLRDEEHLEDVAGWANAVLAFLKDTVPAVEG